MNGDWLLRRTARSSLRSATLRSGRPVKARGRRPGRSGLAHAEELCGVGRREGDLLYVPVGDEVAVVEPGRAGQVGFSPNRVTVVRDGDETKAEVPPRHAWVGQSHWQRLRNYDCWTVGNVRHAVVIGRDEEREESTDASISVRWIRCGTGCGIAEIPVPTGEGVAVVVNPGRSELNGQRRRAVGGAGSKLQGDWRGDADVVQTEPTRIISEAELKDGGGPDGGDREL